MQKRIGMACILIIGLLTTSSLASKEEVKINKAQETMQPTQTIKLTPSPTPTIKPTPTLKPTAKPTKKPTPVKTTIKKTARSTVKPTVKKTTKPIIKSNTSSYELNLLACIIHQEARGCSNYHQLLVGNVVVNRVKSSKFPNSIRSVIYQRGQYSGSGSISSVNPNSDCIKNAKRILNGERFCPSNVLYQSQERQGKGVWKKVGNTYFCYG